MKLDILTASAGINLSPKNLAGKADAAAHTADFTQQLKLAASKSQQRETSIEAVLASFVAAQQTSDSGLQNMSLAQFSLTGGDTAETADIFIGDESLTGADLIALSQAGPQQTAPQQAGAQQVGAQQSVPQQAGVATSSGTQQLLQGINQSQDAGLAKPALTTTMAASSSLAAAATAEHSTAARDLLPQNPTAIAASPLAADAAKTVDKIKAATPATAIDHGAASAASTASGSLGKTAPVTATLSTPVANPQWAQDFSQQMLRLTQHGSQRVSLQLNPVELGPLTIDIKLSDQQAQLQLLSTNAQVRQVLEFAIPQLREALSEQGINLSQANVGEHQLKEQSSRQSADNRNATPTTADGDVVEESSDVTGSVSDLSASGAVNLYV